jgi:uncharacterized protein (TIGR03435 family)
MNTPSVKIGVNIDGAQFHSTLFALKDYIRIAYQVKDYQIVCPDWVGSERFDISAKIPDGVGRDKVPAMMLALLETRFGLKVHRDKKDFPVYALIVKDKSKLTPSVVDPDEAAAAAKEPVQVAASGSQKGVMVNMGHGAYFNFTDNKFEAKKLTLASLAETLARFMDRPILDMTDQPGLYDFNLEITPEDYRTMLIRSAVAAGVVLPPEALKLLDSATDDSLHRALAATGLKLDPRKAPLDVIVVDHAEKTPIAN